MSRSNGRPEPEVIMNFSDGFSYSKGKLEEAYKAVIDNGPVKPPKDAVAAPKKDDVDIIMAEFQIPKAQAEKILLENDKDVVKAMHALINVAESKHP